MGELNWSGRRCLPQLRACLVPGSGGRLEKFWHARPIPSQAKQELAKAGKF